VTDAPPPPPYPEDRPSTYIPPPPSGPVDAPPPAYAAPLSSADRVRNAWHGRAQTDYIFDFATAFGWTLLTCGFYRIYVTYQLMRRSREHNLRRIELLDAGTTFAWERANARGRLEEFRPAFDRIAQQMQVLRAMSTEFRDPTIWAIIALFTGGIGTVIAFVLLDGDLVRHDYAEGAVEHELSIIYTQLGAPIPPPDATRLKAKHNYGGRIVATILTCGIYGLWWEYDVMTEGNRHFQHNWTWEDSLAASVQQLMLT
jgi:hypothetical protein